VKNRNGAAKGLLLSADAATPSGIREFGNLNLGERLVEPTGNFPKGREFPKNLLNP
jgi:hypothetical protein